MDGRSFGPDLGPSSLQRKSKLEDGVKVNVHHFSTAFIVELNNITRIISH